jgi:colanic acid biosynthesis glycosyl transferase WcaI
MARVLLHSLTFSPDAVSTGYLMTDLARQLQRMGNEVTVLTTTPHYNLEAQALARQPLRRQWLGLVFRSELDGVQVWHIKIPMKGQRVFTRVIDYIYFHLMALVLGLTAIGSYEIVITPSPPLTIGLVGWLLGLRRGVPFVYNVQELYPDFAINQGIVTNPWFIKMLRWLERFVYDRSAEVVTISEWFSRIIVARGVPESRVRMIPNSVDTSLFRPYPRDNEFARQHDLVNGFVVLYGGNIGLSQDWESFMRAAEELAHLPIRFVVVGGGARGEWLERECAGRKLANIRLLGYQSRTLMPLVNASSDLCTIPMKATTTTDTFPSKIYTIMACAKPVLVQADEDSELNWLVRTVGFGRVASPDDSRGYTDAVRCAFEERARLPEEGLRGHAYVLREYSTEAVGRKYDVLIQELTGRQWPRE